MKRFANNTNKFFNRNITNFVLLLPKAVYPYEYMGNCETFD